MYARLSSAFKKSVSAALAISLGVLMPTVPCMAVEPPALDPGSTAATKTANAGATIMVGGVIKNVSPGDSLTHAEFIALQQVLGGGHQSLQVAGNGAASGGSFALSTLGGNFSQINIPANVTAMDTSARALNVTGALTTSGALIGLLGGANYTINASDVLVNAGGKISTIQANGQGTLGLIINAVNNIVNNGIISSSKNLSLNAGGSIINGAGSVINSQTVLNMLTGSGQITNAGSIIANTGNINFGTTTPVDLVINNAGGTISALLGSVNLRNAQYQGTQFTALKGGSVFAKTVNFYGGKGEVNAALDNIEGIVNINACSAHILSNSPLMLGAVNLTGDPSFVSTTGDLTLTSNQIFPGQKLALVAQRNVVANANVKKIETSSTNGNGGDLVIIAGFDMTPVIGQNVELTGAQTVELTGGNAFGGDIILPGVSIKTGSTVGNGGSVTMAAYNGLVGGNITVGSIDTSAPKGQAGAVTIIAPKAITIGGTTAASPALKASGATGNDVKIFGSQPGWLVTAPVIDATGAMVNSFNNNAFSANSSLKLTGVVDTKGTAGNGGEFRASVGNGLEIKGSVDSSTSSINNHTAGDIRIGTANGMLNVSGSLIAAGLKTTTNGGLIQILAPGGAIEVGGKVDNHAGNQAGTILVTADDRILFKDAVVSTGTGPNGKGGNVTINQTGGTSGIANLELLKGLSTSGVSKGGNINLNSNKKIFIGFNQTSQVSLPVTSNKSGLDTSSAAGQAGNIALTADDEINIAGNIKATSKVMTTNQTTSLTGHAIRVDGKIDVSTTAGGGNAGSINMLTPIGNLPNFGIDIGSISANGGNANISLDAQGANILIRGDLSAKGLNTNSMPASVMFTSERGFEVAGKVDLSTLGATGGSLAYTLVGPGESPSRAKIGSDVNLSASGANSTGGALTMMLPTGINIGGNIVSTGTTSGGTITLFSQNAPIAIGKGINVSGNSPTGGKGGSIIVLGTDISIGGNVNAAGGAASGANNAAGNGGTVGIGTSMAPNNARIGTVLINGAIDVRGGNIDKANGQGNGGTAFVTAGTIRITGTGAGGASVNASGGTNKANGQGAGGTIMISSQGTQDIPINFDLTSSTASEYALPGGLFEVGKAGINGSAGKIVSNGNIINTGTNITGAALSNGNITITPGTNMATIVQGGANKTIFTQNGVGANAPRTKVTPGQALALFETTHGYAQNFTLNNSGVVESGTITIGGYEFNKQPSTFKIQGKNGPVTLELDLTNTHPTAAIDLSKASTIAINNNLHLTDSSATVDNKAALFILGNKTLNLAKGAQLVDVSLDGISSYFQGGTTTTILNNGTIATRGMIVYGNGGAMKITMGDGAVIGSSSNLTGLMLLNGKGSRWAGSVAIQNASPSAASTLEKLTINLTGGSVQLGTGSATPQSISSPVLSQSSFSGIRATGNAAIYSQASIPGNRSSYIAGGNLTFMTGGDIQIGTPIAGNFLQAGNNLSITAAGDINLVKSNKFFAGKDLSLLSYQELQDDTANGNKFVTGGNLSLSGLYNGVTMTAPNTVAAEKDVRIFSQSGNISLGLDGTAKGAIAIGSNPLLSVVHNASTTLTTTSVGLAAEKTLSLDANGAGIVVVSSGSILRAAGVNLTNNGTNGIGLFQTTIFSSKDISIKTAGPSGVLLFQNNILVAGKGGPGLSINTVANKNAVVSAGNLTIDSGGTITVGAGSLLESVGGDTKLIARGGNLSLGNGSLYAAVGGNLILLSNEDVIGGASPGAGQSGNTFFATSLVSGASFKGGGIEIKAGTTISTIANAVANRGPFMQTGQIALVGIPAAGEVKGQVTFGDNTVVTLNNTGGLAKAVNVQSGGSPVVNSVIIVNGTDANHTVTLDSVNMTSITPVSATQSADSPDEYIVDCGDDEDNDFMLTAAP